MGKRTLCAQPCCYLGGSPTRCEHLKELGLPALDELEGVGQHGLTGQPRGEGLLGHVHVWDQLVTELLQALENT